MQQKVIHLAETVLDLASVVRCVVTQIDKRCAGANSGDGEVKLCGLFGCQSKKKK